VIDLHLHILPGIDDGPESDAGSVALGAVLAAQGVRIAAATPHLRDDHPRVRVDELADRCAALNDTLLSSGVPLHVVPAAEVDILWARQASDDELRLASYEQHGRDVLIETPYGVLPDSFEELVDEIAARGYRILLAHPERNVTLQRDPERLARLVDRGLLLQVTASSLASTDRRSGSRRLALELVRTRMAHVIASDAHRADGARRPFMTAARDVADGVAPGLGRGLVAEAPASVLAGEPLRTSDWAPA
jgi:protein-tyrosine phosphatase